MSKLTTFQELRHRCAKLYCPSNWTIALWADFFGDCFKLHALNGDEKDEAVLKMTETYSCSESLVNATVAFQRDNKMIED